MRYRKLLRGYPSLLLIVLFSHCTKIKSTTIGEDLLPALDNITTFDTSLSVFASTAVTPDSLLPRLGVDANGGSADYILGSISNDPVFGKTSASIFLEFRPLFYPFTYEAVKDSLFLDSVVLSLQLSTLYGDTNALQQIAVHRVTELLRYDSSYRTDKQVQYSSELGSKTFAPSVLNDSIFLRGYTTTNKLRIRLNNSFGTELLSLDTSSVGNGAFRSDSAFRQYLKGFGLIPQLSGQGSAANALMTFSLGDSATHIRLYYRFKKDGKFDTTSKTFVTFNGVPSASVNQISRTYTGSQAARFLGQSNAGDSLVFIQGSPGTFAQLRIPGIDQLKRAKGNILVHLAQLSMEEVQTPGKNAALTAPGQLYLEILDTIRGQYLPFFSDAFTNGSFDPVFFGSRRKLLVASNGDNYSSYSMNITRYFQGIVTRNNTNFPFGLSAPYSVVYSALQIGFGLNPLGYGQVVLGGGNHPTRKMKLRIVYSTL